MSQSELARRLGTTRQAVQLWYAGKTAPGVYYTLAIQIITEGAVPMESWLSRKEQLALEALRKQHPTPGPTE